MKQTGYILMALLFGALPLHSQFVIIPDAAFLSALIGEGVDKNGDSLISTGEAELITYLDIEGSWENGQIREIKIMKISTEGSPSVYFTSDCGIAQSLQQIEVRYFIYPATKGTPHQI